MQRNLLVGCTGPRSEGNPKMSGFGFWARRNYREQGKTILKYFQMKKKKRKVVANFIKKRNSVFKIVQKQNKSRKRSKEGRKVRILKSG